MLGGAEVFLLERKFYAGMLLELKQNAMYQMEQKDFLNIHYVHYVPIFHVMWGYFSKGNYAFKR